MFLWALIRWYNSRLHPPHVCNCGLSSYCFYIGIALPLHLDSGRYPSRSNQAPHHMQHNIEPGLHPKSQADDILHWRHSCLSYHHTLYPLLCGRSLLRHPLNGCLQQIENLTDNPYVILQTVFHELCTPLTIIENFYFPVMTRLFIGRMLFLYKYTSL